jgi:hypothetical protein
MSNLAVDSSSQPFARRILPLLSLAENAIYTAKNHYKSADINRYMRYAVNVLTTASLFLVLIPYLQPFSALVQTIAAVAAMANVMLVTGYLSVYRELELLKVGDQFKCIYEDCFKTFCASQSLADIEKQYEVLQKKFNSSERKPISKLARVMCKWSLEHNDPNKDEVDLRWLRDAKARILNG